MSSVGLILIAVLLGSFGQIFFKLGTRGVNIGFDSSMVKILFTPYVLLGLCLYAVSTIAFLKVLSQEALSFAYPMISLTYPLVLFFSRFIFKEPVGWLRWLGVLFIMFGVFLVGKKL